MLRRRKAVGTATAIALTVAITASTQAAHAARVEPGSWTIAQVFSASSGVLELDGVDAVSGIDAWLTGEVFQAKAGQAPILVENWNGSSWQQIPVPASVDPKGLSIAGDMVGASSPSNAWVFGGYQGVAGPFEVALGWNGTTWSKFSFPLFSDFNSTAVFSPTNAWVFGNDENGQSLVYRFNGTTWGKQTVPLVPQGASALSPSNMWITGPTGSPQGTAQTFAVAHWNGGAWQATDLPSLKLPKGASLVSTGILALSSKDIWVTGSLGGSRGVAPGWVVLHLTASGWHRLKVPFPPGSISGISSDGGRGIWLTADADTSANEYFLHYAGGTWTRQLAPGTAGDTTQMNSISWAAGASAGWSGGDVVNSDGNSQGALMTFSP